MACLSHFIDKNLFFYPQIIHFCPLNLIKNKQQLKKQEALKAILAKKKFFLNYGFYDGIQKTILSKLT